MSGPRVRVSEVVLHVDDLDAATAFWAGALEQAPDRAEDGTWVGFGLAPGLVLVLLPPEQWEGVGHCVHLSLSPALGLADSGVARLRALGGRVVDRVGPRTSSAVVRTPDGCDLVVHRC